MYVHMHMQRKCMFICKENVCMFICKENVCMYVPDNYDMRGGVDRYTPSPIYRATNSRGHPNPRKKALSIFYPLSALPRENPDQTLESTQIGTEM
jgi:hypothetical protein